MAWPCSSRLRGCLRRGSGDIRGRTTRAHEGRPRQRSAVSPEPADAPAGRAPDPHLPRWLRPEGLPGRDQARLRGPGEPRCAPGRADPLRGRRALALARRRAGRSGRMAHGRLGRPRPRARNRGRGLRPPAPPLGRRREPQGGRPPRVLGLERELVEGAGRPGRGARPEQGRGTAADPARGPERRCSDDHGRRHRGGRRVCRAVRSVRTGPDAGSHCRSREQPPLRGRGARIARGRAGPRDAVLSITTRLARARRRATSGSGGATPPGQATGG